MKQVFVYLNWSKSESSTWSAFTSVRLHVCVHRRVRVCVCDDDDQFGLMTRQPMRDICIKMVYSLCLVFKGL